MKIWLNEQYAIENSDGNNVFAQGNDNFDKIEVYIPTASINKDNTLPQFKFKRADGNVYGPSVHNALTYNEGKYTVFPYKLSKTLLAVKGPLTVTIEIKFYNDNNVIIKDKNVTAIGVVTESVTVNDNIYIIGNASNVLENVNENIEAINARVNSLETAVIGEVSASVNNDIGIANVIVEVDDSNPRTPNIHLNFENLKGDKGDKGEQGLQGLKGDKGDKGPQGNSGVTAPSGSLFTLYVDNATGNLYLLSNTDETPKFEYDEATGNLYVVHEANGETVNWANGDDLVYGTN